MTDKHILIVEDEVKIAYLLRDYLKNAGYAVTCMDRGDTVVSYVRKESPMLILLDIMLPGADGTDICREIREFSDVPIIMITAKVEEMDRILGLELGADDYICKPFSPREVIARVKAVLRRSSPDASDNIIRLGPVWLDKDTHQAGINEDILKLTPSEYELLKVMIANPNRVFPRAELISRVLGYDYEGYDRTIDTHVKNLRKKMAAVLSDQEVICTVYAVGYKFNFPFKLMKLGIGN